MKTMQFTYQLLQIRNLGRAGSSSQWQSSLFQLGLVQCKSQQLWIQAVD